VRLPVAGALVLAAGCTPAGAPRAPEAPQWLGVETALLADDLVQLRVAAAGAAGAPAVEDYARCAAAQYALARGAGFARHVRTRVGKTAGVWRADAIYTISAELPRGVRTLDAEVVVEDCAARGIPTV
jgi:hypothetical protein